MVPTMLQLKHHCMWTHHDHTCFVCICLSHHSSSSFGLTDGVGKNMGDANDGNIATSVVFVIARSSASPHCGMRWYGNDNKCYCYLLASMS